jgi:hypothetical protein
MQFGVSPKMSWKRGGFCVMADEAEGGNQSAYERAWNILQRLTPAEQEQVIRLLLKNAYARKEKERGKP